MNQIRQPGMRDSWRHPERRRDPDPLQLPRGAVRAEYFTSPAAQERDGGYRSAYRRLGYLTRRLVDGAGRHYSRGRRNTEGGIWVREITDGNQVIEKFEDRLRGRYAAGPVLDKEGNELVPAGKLIDEEDIKKILKASIKEVRIRSVLTCRSRHGVCAKCYGSNLATGTPVNVGEAVGIIAAQSIGEPGTRYDAYLPHWRCRRRRYHPGSPACRRALEARKPRSWPLWPRSRHRPQRGAQTCRAPEHLHHRSGDG